ncbi:MAG: hypothetical protein IPK83_23585 [Planctomycetes bacterium]|nr:hypothetical protein [Planctomycetota bacterium]
MIRISNIGPIANAAIQIPEDGGVVVLRGRNGSGKSIALEAVNAAVSGKGKPPLKDLAKQGSVSAAGVNLTVGRAVRRSGELEVSTLEGRLSVADLVDPGIADPIRADATRIKALVGLSGATIDPGDLHGFPENLLDGIDLDEPVAAMAELRKRLNIGASEYEKLAAKDEAAAKALLESLEELDGAAIDPDKAQERVTQALRAIDRLEGQIKLAVDASARNKAARDRLALIPVVGVDAAQRDAARLEDVTAKKKTLALKLKSEYEAALADYKTSVVDRDAAIANAEDAQAQAKLRAELERQISESEIAKPSYEEIEAANSELAAAKAEQTKAAQQQAMNQQRIKSDELFSSSQEHAQEAIDLRRKAKQTDEVLSEIVSTLAGCPLTVSEGRLSTQTKRGPTFYADLSMGERWRIALEIAIAAVGEGGLLVIPQEAWEGLDPLNREAIAKQAKAARVVILTAECSDSEFSAEMA